MSSIQLQGNSSGTGVMNVSSPNTNTNYTITLPQANTTLVGKHQGQPYYVQKVIDCISSNNNNNVIVITINSDKMDNDIIFFDAKNKNGDDMNIKTIGIFLLSYFFYLIILTFFIIIHRRFKKDKSENRFYVI